MSKTGFQTTGRARQRAQEMFLAVVRAKRPGVMEDLSNEPLSLYLEADLPVNPVNRRTWTQLVQGSETPDNPLLLRLKESLIEWQRRWHLEETEGDPKWCLATAVLTLAEWKSDNSDNKILDWSYHRTVSVRDWINLEPPLPDFDYWLSGISHKEYLKEVREAANRQLEAKPLSILKESRRRAIISDVVEAAEKYMHKLEERYKSDGWEAVTKRPMLRDHLIWAVKYQVVGMNYNQITRETKPTVTTNAVRKAIRETLEYIGIRAREADPPGRPRGSKNSEGVPHRPTKLA
jgi:hypothetical protein